MASVQQQRGKGVVEKGLSDSSSSSSTEKVVVAVKASKEISRTALVWALRHVVQPGDCIILLVLIPTQSSGRKFWGFPIFAGDCASGHRRSNSLTATLDQKSDISESCSQMMLQLHDVYDPNKINVKIKIVSGTPTGAVAAESKRAHASWVVLDKELRQEEKRCMEELQCNIVVMKRSQPKVLRLNLVGSPDKGAHAQAPNVPSGSNKSTEKLNANTTKEPRNNIRGPAVTPTSSPELETSFTGTEAGTSSVSSSDPATSPFSPCENNLKKEIKTPPKDEITSANLEVTTSDSDSSDSLSPETISAFKPWMAEILRGGSSMSKRMLQNSPSNQIKAEIGSISGRSDSSLSRSIRDAVSLSRSAPPGPPPLCSICQHKAPVFGKPPLWFSYAELELATGGFSKANFLAEGGFGSVHRGILPDGQAVAVKQHKLASTQGDNEFCSEVEVLSCAQHRNVVMLIGFCVEDKRRLLVYEYICNGSLDSHLYGRNNRETLEWSARQKIAVGAARGLRYLHEECRVGCIIHRDMRPNNILLTHDFEPLVGDFGLARWQPDGDMGVETRVIGTFGYMAPEYAQSGQITEKADVYSFGVVLVELVTGRKAVDINRPKGQQFLTEWARPLLEEYDIEKLIDPRLEKQYSEHEVYCMLHAASLCIRRDPHSRPRMSQVLRMLEGDVVMESGYISTPSYDIGNRSRRIMTDQKKSQQERDEFLGPVRTESLRLLEGKQSHEVLKAAWDRERESLVNRS
ncbi:Inactive protein kinase [Rhynchospora pubera]|uniref:Inactive protein kinase n=1 Tax=Rhynchospora pubera TaxID=906938 RepID=A0AAV8HYD6_9POAL|nr:Inactive protein kinase [Rhynchospora pubera]